MLLCCLCGQVNCVLSVWRGELSVAVLSVWRGEEEGQLSVAVLSVWPGEEEGQLSVAGFVCAAR